MMGLLFALPIHAQAVHGLDAQATGLRLLPLIGGMLLTALPSGGLAARLGARVVVSVRAWWCSPPDWRGAPRPGWARAAGARPGWTLVCGAGLGMTLPTAMDAALGVLPEDASGTGSAVLQAMRMVGSSFGAAVLGSVLIAGYRNHLGESARRSTGCRPGGGCGPGRRARCGRRRRPARARTVAAAARSAYVSGMDQMLWVAIALGLAGAVLSRSRWRVTATRSPHRTRQDSEHEPDSVA